VAAEPVASGENVAIRVMSWNIRSGFGSFDLPPELAGSSQLGTVATAIAASGADIVGLQEVDRFWDRSAGVDQPAELAAALGFELGYGANWLPSGGAPGEGVPQYGTAILSRWPIVAIENVLASTPPGWEPRGLLVATIRLPGDHDLRVINTHLQVDRQGESASDQRAAQLELALRIAASRETPCLITGDLNATPGSEELARVEAADSGFIDCWPSLHSGEPGYTIPASPVAAPERRIDYIFASAALRVTGSAVLVTDQTRLASDHYPVVADIELT
jgi:endonuclease/exonuclease/phosphatase family metal-dependent hydrolase